MTTPEPIVTATRYDVSCLPVDDINRLSLTITVEYRGYGKWCVSNGRTCYDIDGNRSFEPIPSSREDEWLERHRFDLDTALALAKRIAPTMKINGRITVADVLAREVGE